MKLYTNNLCNRYRLNIISADVTIAFATEYYENSILAKEDTGELELK
ncbi:MAG: aldehyde ferredoxin oxidoreductase C-terminal domain-containing protein [Candidatus Bathyarchaeia archaeon]